MMMFPLTRHKNTNLVHLKGLQVCHCSSLFQGQRSPNCFYCSPPVCLHLAVFLFKRGALGPTHSTGWGSAAPSRQEESCPGSFPVNTSWVRWTSFSKRVPCSLKLRIPYHLRLLLCRTTAYVVTYCLPHLFLLWNVALCICPDSS